jgi:uncharacterized phage-associated protein
MLWIKDTLAAMWKGVANMMKKPANRDSIVPGEAIFEMDFDDSLVVANSILDKAFSENVPVTNLKLQKLLYLVYKQFLKINGGEPLFGETFEAWPHGPVLPSAYHMFKYFGSKPITQYAHQPFGNPNDIKIVDPGFSKFYEVLEHVWVKYGNKSSSELVDLTHQGDSVWSKVWGEQSVYLLPDDVRDERDWD